jgi:hypothetical protein
MITGKIVGVKEEADTPARLVADGGRLPVAVRLCEEQGGLGCAHRPQNHPALALSEIGILQYVKAETIPVEGDRRVVIGHHEGDAGNGAAWCRVRHR